MNEERRRRTYEEGWHMIEDDEEENAAADQHPLTHLIRATKEKCFFFYNYEYT